MFLTNLNLVLQAGGEVGGMRKGKNNLNSTVASLPFLSMSCVPRSEDELGAMTLLLIG